MAIFQLILLRFGKNNFDIKMITTIMLSVCLELFEI